MIVQQANNSKIQPGQPGAFEATRYVRLLEQPTSLDRAQGDIHAAGNPHIQTDPRMMLTVSKALAQRFAQLDPANAATYQSREADFDKRWRRGDREMDGRSGAAQGHAHRRAAPCLDLHGELAGPARSRCRWSPSRACRRPAVISRRCFRSCSSNRRNSSSARPMKTTGRRTFISEKAGIPAIVLPFTVGGTDDAKDLFSLYDDTIHRMLGGLKK